MVTTKHLELVFIPCFEIFLKTCHHLSFNRTYYDPLLPYQFLEQWKDLNSELVRNQANRADHHHHG